MKTKIKMVLLPREGEMGQSFSIQMPTTANIERGGLDPKTDRPALWYTIDTLFANEVDERRFVIVPDGSELEGDVVHVGMWWVGTETYHIFELMTEG